MVSGFVGHTWSLLQVLNSHCTVNAAIGNSSIWVAVLRCIQFTEICGGLILPLDHSFLVSVSVSVGQVMLC